MPEQKRSVGSICFAAADDCVNPDSYGHICVGCWQCETHRKEKEALEAKGYRWDSERGWIPPEEKEQVTG